MRGTIKISLIVDVGLDATVDFHFGPRPFIICHQEAGKKSNHRTTEPLTDDFVVLLQSNLIEVDMTLHKWSEIEEEKLTDSISRKYITGDRVTMAIFTLKKGCTVQTHSHENEQLSTVLSGAMKFIVAGEEILVRTGETLRIPPMTPHGAEALEDTENLDVFAPVRSDWIEGKDDYLKSA